MTLSPHVLAQVVDEAAKAVGTAGAQVAVLVDGQILEASTGWADRRSCRAVTPRTLFQIGSTTKLHTALLVHGLVREGRLDLDRPVGEVLPELRLPAAEALDGLTPRHLLSMSSGLDNGPYTDTGRGDDAVARYVALLTEVPLQAMPGEMFGYSNASTNVSGRLVEVLTGLTWDDALRQRLLEPEGLSETYSLPEEVIHRDFAVGHGPDGEAVESWALPRGCGPAGGTLCATASDLVRLAQLFFRRDDLTDEVHRPQVAVPPTLVADFWGLGPYGARWGDTLLYGHSGTNSGGSSCLLWSREHRVAVAAAVNTSPSGYPFARRVCDAVFSHLLPATVERRSVAPAPAHDVTAPAAVDRFVGRYEMCGGVCEVRLDASGGGLVMTLGDATSPLLPLGGDTFLPMDEAVSGGRGWAIAFRSDDSGQVSHVVNGLFAMRRVPA